MADREKSWREIPDDVDLSKCEGWVHRWTYGSYGDGNGPADNYVLFHVAKNMEHIKYKLPPWMNYMLKKAEERGVKEGVRGMRRALGLEYD